MCVRSSYDRPPLPISTGPSLSDTPVPAAPDLKTCERPLGVEGVQVWRSPPVTSGCLLEVNPGTGALVRRGFQGIFFGR